MQNKALVEMLTVRQVAATGILTEHCIRQLIKEGRLAGIQVGNRYLVNYTALCRQLELPDLQAAGGALNE